MAKKQIKTGLESIDSVTGGYPAGGVCIVRCLDKEPSALQDFIVSQVKQVCVEDKATVLVCTLDMNSMEFAKCLIAGETPQNIRRIMESKMYISEKGKDINDKNFIAKLTTSIDGTTFNSVYDIVFIDSIEKILKDSDMETVQDIVSDIIELAEDNETTIVVSDYGDLFPAPYPRPSNVMEIELKTDIQDIVQANVYRGGNCDTVTDLYGQWSVFNKILKS